MFRKLTSAAFLAAMMAAASTAHAERAPEMSVTLHYGDLDLTSESGARTLLQRLRAASRKVCGYGPGQREVAVNTSAKVCIDRSTAQAVAAIDAPLLTALYTGQPIASQLALR